MILMQFVLPSQVCVFFGSTYLDILRTINETKERRGWSGPTKKEEAGISKEKTKSGLTKEKRPSEWTGKDEGQGLMLL